MALKDRLRNQRSKRFGNVVTDRHSESEEMSFSSSDSESGVLTKRIKVSSGFSTKRLMKESECYKVDNDHIYTSVGSPEDYNSVRKRKMSDDSNEKPVKKRCVSKNAVMARLNRERKKKYISSLESENESLRKENNEKSRKIDEQSKRISSMKREILYFKGLLANSKELGQILSQLKETTGLPVTSSIISSSERETQSLSQVITKQDKPSPEHQPRIRSVNSGSNFPILHKDVNLGSCSDIDMAGPENCPFDFDNDYYDFSLTNNNDSFFNFGPQNSDSDLDEYFKLNGLSKSDPQVGICLHLNQRRISLEFCSICNSKAESQMRELPDEVKKEA